MSDEPFGDPRPVDVLADAPVVIVPVEWADSKAGPDCSHKITEDAPCRCESVDLSVKRLHRENTQASGEIALSIPCHGHLQLMTKSPRTSLEYGVTGLHRQRRLLQVARSEL